MELQVQIDDVTACPGRCTGCALSADERKSTEPDMAPGVLDRVLEALGDYIATLRPESVNITYGIADHLLVGERYVGEQLYAKTAALLAVHGYNDGRSTVFFSASLVANRNVAARQIAYLESFPRLPGVDMVPVVVVDPQNLRHPTFGAQWRAYAAMANKAFGRIDLALNLSAVACALITPQELLDYVNEYGFQEVTINWTPTDGNLVATASDMPGLAAWLIDFADRADACGVSYSYGPVMSRAANAVMCRHAGAPLADVIDTVVDPTIRHSIHIDADGSLYPKFEAIGDIPHSPRFGYPAMGNVLDKPIARILDEQLPAVKRRILSEHLRDRRCVGCKHLNVCATTGFHAYSHVMEGKYGDASCPHVARVLWDQTFGSLQDPDPGNRDSDPQSRDSAT